MSISMSMPWNVSCLWSEPQPLHGPHGQQSPNFNVVIGSDEHHQQQKLLCFMGWLLFFWGTRHGKWMKEWPIELDYLPLNSMVSIANWTKGQRVSNKRATKIFYCAYISTLIPKLITVFSFALCPKLHASPFTRGLIMSQLMDSDVFQYIGQWNPRTNHQPTMVLNKSYPLYSVH